MCGVVGAFGPSGASTDWLAGAADAMRHRGPDDQGVWCDPVAGVALAHRRLAILDLSAAGHQPMTSRGGRFHVVLNGEIYNHLELRRELGHVPWRGHSDTETLLECMERWGVERTLAKLSGMFAFGLFDAHERRLILARDRFGEKPLYYGYAGASLVFASELRPLRRAPGFDATLDEHALALFMRHSCVPGPYCIYASVRKLPPGSWLEITPRHLAARSLASPQRYWSAADVATAAQRAPLDIDDTAAIDELERLLGASVRRQMISDVPLGAFLSGGVDSSTIVALMQRQSPARVRTFSIGFAESDFDESHYARRVAEHLGTDHTELTVTPAETLAVVPNLPRIYDEPFADSSQIPTFLVAQLARTRVKVALSGDAGDELFGG
jgi:asparagine synthase (glutamine-hydrolysing)